MIYFFIIRKDWTENKSKKLTNNCGFLYLKNNSFGDTNKYCLLWKINNAKNYIKTGSLDRLTINLMI